ncbi:hypothetical protein JCM10213v2_007108 [Rhodosporidiobolus nylandii]
MPKRALVSIGVDVDAVCGWISTYGKGDSPNDITRGMFAGEASWFVPIHSLQTFPKEMAAVRDAGHELGLHGWCHECQTKLSLEQQVDVLDASIKALTEFTGKPPVGSTSCWWETSKESVNLLLERGIQYDHSSQAHDCEPFYSRDEDKWTTVDLSKKAETWMKPLVRGKTVDLVQIPANWYLDDLPPHLYIKDYPNSHGYVDVDSTLKLWKTTFDYFYREEELVFPSLVFSWSPELTAPRFPDVSGRPHVLMMLERFIEYVKGVEGVEFVTMEQINKDFRERQPFKPDEQQ